MHTHWRGADRHTDGIFCRRVSRPFTCNGSGSRKERRRRRHQNPDERIKHQHLHRTGFTKNNMQEKVDLLTHLSTTFSSATLEAGGSDALWAGTSGELLPGGWTEEHKTFKSTQKTNVKKVKGLIRDIIAAFWIEKSKTRVRYWQSTLTMWPFFGSLNIWWQAKYEFSSLKSFEGWFSM